MFKKILIANRGEIACRIARTCKKMGIKTIGIYSDADSNSLHLDYMDEKVNIGPADSANSYLNIKILLKLLKIIKRMPFIQDMDFYQKMLNFQKL